MKDRCGSHAGEGKRIHWIRVGWRCSSRSPHRRRRAGLSASLRPGARRRSVRRGSTRRRRCPTSEDRGPPAATSRDRLVANTQVRRDGQSPARASSTTAPSTAGARGDGSARGLDSGTRTAWTALRPEEREEDRLLRCAPLRRIGVTLFTPELAGLGIGAASAGSANQRASGEPFSRVTSKDMRRSGGVPGRSPVNVKLTRVTLVPADPCTVAHPPDDR